MGVTGGQGDVVAEVMDGGHGEEADGAAADHDDALAGNDGSAAGPVPGDAGGFHQAGVVDREAGWERHQVGAGHRDPVAQAPVGEDPEVGVRTDATLGVSRLALRTRATGDRRVDGVRHAVDEPGELMADREPGEPGGDEIDVGTADARRRHLDDDTVARRIVDLDDAHPLLGVAHRSHAGVCAPWCSPTRTASRAGSARLSRPMAWSMWARSNTSPTTRSERTWPLSMSSMAATMESGV